MRTGGFRPAPGTLEGKQFGLSLEETMRQVAAAKEFAAVPKEGPEARFFSGNVEGLYRALTGG